eukprot:TRINITY_DN1159_c0_g1_i2.p1 TRINITY_DN1159_c0_g1~~TRINITY_DN1159_c0_g1_i2.p1  ORF type:complete len:501 (-),score=58.61 TRINITY_DN1159_c0_g1_i2:223-1725(-)
MDSQAHQLHMFFLPFMAPGHTIPMIDMAKLFAERGVKVTIITTTSIASLIENTIERANELYGQIELSLLRFPTKEAGLPEGCDNVNSIRSPESFPLFFKAIDMLQDPIEQLLRDRHPNCIVTDMFIPWTVDAADKFGIPTLLFHGTSYFSLCISESLYRYKPHENVATDTETFIIPGLPHPVKITRAELPGFVKSPEKHRFNSIIDRFRWAEKKCYGVVMNSFYELEPAFADHYKEVKSKAWHIGPVSLCNTIIADKAERGNKASIDQADCLRWLDTKKPGSVIYVCFGSMCKFTTQQLLELAMGLEASNHDFIWVVREGVIDWEKEDWLPLGFEERLNGKGLIIRGWAPQILILDHPSIGGFVTHCGWNSVLESVSAGLPMITWPLFAEQFYNEKLITQVLEIGIAVGVGVWVERAEERVLVTREAVEKAVSQLMGGGEEADGMRKRAKELGEMAKRAVKKGGSSYVAMDSLIEELMTRCRQGDQNGSFVGKGRNQATL